MTAEVSSDKLGFDSSVFENSVFPGEINMFSGREGLATELGRYYFLKSGFTNTERSCGILTLDVDDKRLTYYKFVHRTQYLKDKPPEKYWTSRVFLNNPGSEPFNEELFFPLVNDFLFQMKMIVIPEMEEAKAKKVTEALKEAIKPLMEYFQKRKGRDLLWVETLQKVS